MYWIVYRFNNGNIEYLYGTDEYGYPIHIQKKSKAWKFSDFAVAANYINLGYCVSKEYN